MNYPEMQTFSVEQLNLMADRLYDVIYGAFPAALVLVEQEAGSKVLNLTATINVRNRQLQAKHVLGVYEFVYLTDETFVRNIGRSMRTALVDHMESMAHDLRNAGR